MTISDSKQAAALIALGALVLDTNTSYEIPLLVTGSNSTHIDIINDSAGTPEPSVMGMVQHWVGWRREYPRHAWALDRVEDTRMMIEVLGRG